MNTSIPVTESVVEDRPSLGWLGDLGYAVAYGPDIAPEGSAPERASFADVILVGRLRAALMKLNPTIPPDAIEEAVRKVTHADTPSLIENNRRLHKPADRGRGRGVPPPGRLGGRGQGVADSLRPPRGATTSSPSTSSPSSKTGTPAASMSSCSSTGCRWPSSNSRTRPTRTRPPGTPSTNSRRTRPNSPSLFGTNALLVASDGLDARVGTLTADWERFMPWRTIDGQEVAAKGLPELDVLVKGVFSRRRLLDLLQNFVVFEVDGPTVVKKLAGYHQYHAVNKAVNCTVAASAPDGDRRVGVVWHTQGSGKSLTMAFYAGQGRPARQLMNNPTLLVLTDRNDLDDQLFGTFSGCHELLRQIAGAGRGPRRPEGEAEGGVRRGRLHHDSEVRPGQGRGVPEAVRPAQHRGDRGRGPPQPVRAGGQGGPGHREHRLRLCQAPAGRPAERLVRRLHRHPHRARRPQHAPGVRRVHRHLRHPAGGGGRGDRQNLLRGPARQARPEGVREADAGRRVRGGHGGRGSRTRRRRPRAGGPGWRPWSAATPGSAWLRKTSWSTSSGGWRRWTARA